MAQWQKSNMLAEPLTITLLVIDAFEKLSVPYLIGGSLASALHGTARSTFDTDLVADIKIEQVESLVRMLVSEFYIDQSMILDAIHHKSSFNIIHLATMFKVDIFISRQRPFDRAQFERRAAQVIATDPERMAYIASAEDTVLTKLEWYRLGGDVSERQWRDVLGVLKVQADRLDLAYLHRWAVELGVADLLAKSLAEAGVEGQIL